MTNIADSLLGTSSIDRVNYETGILLNDSDFIAEQTYHRGRLARLAGYLIGTGTAAGLRVTHAPASEATETEVASEEKLMVEPGLAVDAYGRMIEVPSHQCMRLNRWYGQQTSLTLNQGWKAADVAWVGAPAGVVVDITVEFIACQRGKTPSFAVGPFDSIDAVAAERIRDSAKLNLWVRSEENPPLPENPWPDVSSAIDPAEAMREAIFTAWQEGAPEAGGLGVFLARMVLVAAEPDPGEAPLRDESFTVAINNAVRPFAVSTAALARWLNLNIGG